MAAPFMGRMGKTCLEASAKSTQCTNGIVSWFISMSSFCIKDLDKRVKAFMPYL
jgi:hypothetical protein